MSAYFLDTSALAKLYIEELGSSWITTLTDTASGNAIVISYLTTVEFYSVLARRQRENTLTATDALTIQTRFQADFDNQYLTVPLEKIVLVRARDLISHHPLRSLDAIQLASALEVIAIIAEPMTFISADRNLLTIAASEGFITDDPNNHP